MGPSEWADIHDKLDFARAGKPMLIGMATILVTVAVAAGFVLSGPATTSEIPAKGTVQADAGDVSAQAESTVFAHVSGAVANPGLYELEHGARVADAVQAAGGFTDNADSNAINLARLVEDGEHIVIAEMGATSESQDGDGEGAQVATSAIPQGLVNINSASAEQLESLPGIGASTAKRIVADRTLNGPYDNVSDLMRVSGIGEKKLAAIADYICV